MDRISLHQVLLAWELILVSLLAACGAPNRGPVPTATSSTPVTALATVTIPTLTPQATALSVPDLEATETATPAEALPATASPTPLALLTSTTTSTPDRSLILEDFNGSYADWQLDPVVNGSGTMIRTSDYYIEGMAAARLDLTSGEGAAALQVNFRDAAFDHTWGERPGTWNWFRAYVYLPSETVGGLGAEDFLTLGGIYASDGDSGWYLRLRQGGALYVIGQRDWDNAQFEFPVYGTFPQDRWVQLELGLHSQSGPGVKRAFAFLLDGDFYGWYNQGRMKDEVYDTAAIGFLAASSKTPLILYVDDWFHTTQAAFPGGSDNRPADALQEQDFRMVDGRQWQIDWGTWADDLVMVPYIGLFSRSARFQAGRNLERMPALESGWAEIESDWAQGTPPGNELLSLSFGGLVAFRKEINREENLEVGYTMAEGAAQIYYSAWTGEAVFLGLWRLPPADELKDGRNLPEPGDILRVRWEQVGEGELRVRASFYDASAEKWYQDVIDDRRDLTSMPDADPAGETINYMDGFHVASAITVDTPYYSIRRYRVGTLETYPNP